MKEQLQDLLKKCIKDLIDKGLISEMPSKVRLDHTKDKSHGDYATNIALMLSKQAKTSPLELAQIIVNQIEEANFIKKTEIAGPGFINFFLSDESSTSIVNEIIELGEMYGQSEIGKGQSILLEYVSANPTGPLHVGHGRGAAYGATVSNLLRNIGFKIDNEYYVNDAGRQMDILTVSIFLRYLALCGETVRFPDNGYQGQYINDIAVDIFDKSGESFKQSSEIFFENICKDGLEGGDKESHIDELIAICIPAKKYSHEWDSELLRSSLEETFKINLPISNWFEEDGVDEEEIVKRVKDQVYQKLKDKKNKYSEELFEFAEKRVMLFQIDKDWREHLAAMDMLRGSVNLRAMGGKDPFFEYKRESFDYFDEMLSNQNQRVLKTLFGIELINEKQKNNNEVIKKQPNRIITKKIGRNDECPCGSGKKYKTCHGS